MDANTNWKNIEAPGIGTVAFPADMGHEEITQALLDHADANGLENPALNTSTAPKKSLPDSPAPKIAPDESREPSEFSLNVQGTKPSGKQGVLGKIGDTIVSPYKDPAIRDRAMLQAAMEVLDGFSTKKLINEGGREEDPFAVALMGRHPGWKQMIPLGIAENVGAAILAKKMKESSNPTIRKLAWLPQVFATADHTAGEINNVIVQSKVPPGQRK